MKDEFQLKTRHWQKKAIQLYTTTICDISFDHISINRQSSIIHIHELGYDTCPVCKDLAPIVNIDIVRPSRLTLICDCGFEVVVNRPELYRSYKMIQ